jgi:regulator of replication initiation timing
MTDRRNPAHRKTRAKLLERIESLMDAVEKLRTQNHHLEEERNDLQEENRALRRDLTESRLINHLEQSMPNVEEDGQSEQDPPPLAERLYEALPSSFSFPVYFQVAEDEDLDMDAARRCLQHFLMENQLVREGSRLRKREEPLTERSRCGDGQSSQLPS